MAPSTSRLVTLEVVGDAQSLAGGIVHLPGGLLGILQVNFFWASVKPDMLSSMLY
jgi:hypothetical protein